MRKKFVKRLCILLVLFFPIIIFSQSAKEDSLKKIAASEKVDTATIDANKLLSIMVQEDKPDDAIHYGFVALYKAKILNDKFRTGQAYMAIGVGYDYKGNLDSCLYYLSEASGSFNVYTMQFPEMQWPGLPPKGWILLPYSTMPESKAILRYVQ